MGFFSNLFKGFFNRDEVKSLPAPQSEENKETNGKRVEETEIKSIQDEIQIIDDKSQDVNTEDKRKVIIC